jgi:hypothetical protein
LKFACLCSGDGGACRSGSNNDKRTAPRPELFVWKRRLETNRRKPQKGALLGSCPGEDISCISEIKRDRSTAPRPEFFVSKRLPERRTQPRESVVLSCPGRVDPAL